MLAKTCQIAQLHADISCSQKAAGFVMAPAESPMAVYKAGIVLCKGHGVAVVDVSDKRDFLSIAEVADLMTSEEITNTRSHAEEKPMNTAVAEQPAVVMTVVPAAPADLGALAAKLNGTRADSAPCQAARVIEAPKAVTTPPVSPAPTGHGRIKSAEEVEEEALLEQIKTLKAQADAIKRARIERERAEREAEKEAGRIARQQAADPLYAFGQAAELRASITLHYGSGALHAVETLLEAGLLAVRHGALVIKKVGDTPAPAASTSRAPAPRQTVEESERDVLRGKVRELIALGFRDSAIAKQLGIADSTVYSMRKRQMHAA